jgi:hypothetical protein
MSADHATLLFLIGLFAIAEIYRISRGTSGKIVAMVDMGLPGVGLPIMKVQVQLSRGEEVTADLACCTACLGRLQVGDHVRVRNSKDGYVVELPWTQHRSCNGDS